MTAHVIPSSPTPAAGPQPRRGFIDFFAGAVLALLFTILSGCVAENFSVTTKFPDGTVTKTSMPMIRLNPFSNPTIGEFSMIIPGPTTQPASVHLIDYKSIIDVNSITAVNSVLQTIGLMIAPMPK
jgi:hypothetical protein